MNGEMAGHRGAPPPTLCGAARDAEAVRGEDRRGDVLAAVVAAVAAGEGVAGGGGEDAVDAAAMGEGGHRGVADGGVRAARVRRPLQPRERRELAVRITFEDDAGGSAAATASHAARTIAARWTGERPGHSSAHCAAVDAATAGSIAARCSARASSASAAAGSGAEAAAEAAGACIAREGEGAAHTPGLQTKEEGPVDPPGSFRSGNAIGPITFLKLSFPTFWKEVGKLTFKKVIGPIAFPLRNEPGGSSWHPRAHSGAKTL
eukprot:gene43-biopygen3002